VNSGTAWDYCAITVACRLADVLGKQRGRFVCWKCFLSSGFFIFASQNWVQGYGTPRPQRGGGGIEDSSHIARHEHRALHGVSRAWHAAGHAAVVAGGVVAGLTPDLLRCSCLIFQCVSSNYDASGNARVTQQTRWARQKRKEKSFDFWRIFLFFNFSNWFHPIRHPPAGGKGAAASESLACLQLGPRF